MLLEFDLRQLPDGPHWHPRHTAYLNQTVPNENCDTQGLHHIAMAHLLQLAVLQQQKVSPFAFRVCQQN